MARTYLMTWVEGRARWTKKYQGRMYVINPATLGVPPTKAESYLAANAWWLAKQAVIDAAAKPRLDTASQSIKAVLDRTPLADLQEMIRRGQAAQQIVQMLEDASVHGQPVPEKYPAVTAMPLADVAVLDLEEGQSLPNEIDAAEVKRLAKQIDATQPDADETIRGQVDSWVRLQHSAYLGGNISGGRYDSYRRTIEIFAHWIGPQQPVACITPSKLQDYYSYLCQQIGAERYSAAYARTLFGCAKMFVKHAAELGVIPLPGNIASRRFKFDDSVQKIVTFTVEEVRHLLTVAASYSQRMQLYMLLMLNCGMYQSDLSELRQDEVDWNEGTITRKRSKTRKKKSAPEVTYQLWPETAALLHQFRSDDPQRVLTTEDGNPLVLYQAKEKVRRYDTVQSCWLTLTKKAGIAKPMKAFRKTGATLLESHEVYGRYAQYFLAQAPESQAAKHYVTPSQDLFFAALEWLRKELLG